MKNLSVLAFCLFLAVTSCVTTPRTPLSGLDPEAFHAEVNGKQVSFYVLTNSRGMEVCLTNYGARVLSIMVPDRNGKMNNVVVGHDMPTGSPEHLSRWMELHILWIRIAERTACTEALADGARRYMM